MEELFKRLKEAMKEGGAAVLVTVIASSGSTPRGAGSRMLVLEDGMCLGTVGGGAVEYQAQLRAREALEKRTSFIQGFTLTRSQTADIGMVCGGDVVVYFQYMSSKDPEAALAVDEALGALERDEDSWLVLDITDNRAWAMGVYSRQRGLKGSLSREWELLENRGAFGAKAVQVQAEGKRFYCEPLVQAGTVYIFGGGHVAQELVPLLAHVGFRCVVYDDRKEFANPQRFPQARETIVGDLEQAGERLHVTGRDYVCIMTRGHQYDYYVQKQMLRAKPCYIGIMGSKNKIRVVTEKLLADGFLREEIEACHMPIGTAIGAETPAEIAVSIAGELIQVRALREGRRKCRGMEEIKKN